VSADLRRPLLTTREAADFLHLRPETLLRWHESGKLRGFRISTRALRFDPDDIEAFLQGTREGPGAGGEAPTAPSKRPAGDVVLQAPTVPIEGGEGAC
jgi:excisionase family DNA binding protein